MDPRHEEIAQWLRDGQEIVRGIQERIEYLAKENERLLSRLGQVEVAFSRADQDNTRVRVDRDHLLAAFNRLAYLVDQIRLARGTDS